MKDYIIPSDICSVVYTKAMTAVNIITSIAIQISNC